MAAPGVRIGIELECLLTERYVSETTPLDLETFAERLVHFYNNWVGPNHPKMHSDIDGMYDGLDVLNEWSITDDVTIATDSPRQYPIEIVSPMLLFRPESTWRGDVTLLFDNLDASCKINTNQSCGTHVRSYLPTRR
ncbi:hypothetical protein FQN54_000872 [Arachnomyces sp. PD_36]|nr:hypothetical protein FQN54_000872 [Arachnomyces sp. PD_36]